MAGQQFNWIGFDQLRTYVTTDLYVLKLVNPNQPNTGPTNCTVILFPKNGEYSMMQV